MIIKNTAKNRGLVNQLAEYITETTPYFRAFIDKRWNLGKDIRFEVSCVGFNSPLMINTAYTLNGFNFKVRIFENKIEDVYDLSQLRYRLEDGEKVLTHLKELIESVQPEVRTDEKD